MESGEVMKRDNWTVIEGDNRPAGPADQCFYCSVAHGKQHKSDCVIRVRTVVVRTTIEWVIEVPEEWDAGMIEFSRNEGSRCADNDISDMQDMIDRLEEVGACTCSLIQTKYLREATPDDERVCAWPENDPHQVTQ